MVVVLRVGEEGGKQKLRFWPFGFWGVGGKISSTMEKESVQVVFIFLMLWAGLVFRFTVQVDFDWKG